MGTHRVKQLPTSELLTSCEPCVPGIRGEFKIKFLFLLNPGGDTTWSAFLGKMQPYRNCLAGTHEQSLNIELRSVIFVWLTLTKTISVFITYIDRISWFYILLLYHSDVSATAFEQGMVQNNQAPVV